MSDVNTSKANPSHVLSHKELCSLFVAIGGEVSCLQELLDSLEGGDVPAHVYATVRAARRLAGVAGWLSDCGIRGTGSSVVMKGSLLDWTAAEFHPYAETVQASTKQQATQAREVAK